MAPDIPRFCESLDRDPVPRWRPFLCLLIPWVKDSGLLKVFAHEPPVISLLNVFVLTLGPVSHPLSATFTEMLIFSVQLEYHNLLITYVFYVTTNESTSPPLFRFQRVMHSLLSCRILLNVREADRKIVSSSATHSTDIETGFRSSAPPSSEWGS